MAHKSGGSGDVKLARSILSDIKGEKEMTIADTQEEMIRASQIEAEYVGKSPAETIRDLCLRVARFETAQKELVKKCDHFEQELRKRRAAFA